MLSEVVHLAFCLVILVKTDVAIHMSCAPIVGGSHGPGSMWPVSVNLELANSSCSISIKRDGPRLR